MSWGPNPEIAVGQLSPYQRYVNFPVQLDYDLPVSGDIVESTYGGHCLVAEFFHEEAKKPPHQRSRSCNIACPCRRCRPTCF